MQPNAAQMSRHTCCRNNYRNRIHTLISFLQGHSYLGRNIAARKAVMNRVFFFVDRYPVVFFKIRKLLGICPLSRIAHSRSPDDIPPQAACHICAFRTFGAVYAHCCDHCGSGKYHKWDSSAEPDSIKAQLLPISRPYVFHIIIPALRQCIRSFRWNVRCRCFPRSLNQSHALFW